MESHLSEEAQWASGLAARLRLIQANFADDPPSQRQGVITEEIERALKLLWITTELTLAFDQLAWALWRQLAPRSAIRREGDFHRLAGPFLAGDADVSPSQVKQLVEKTRRLMSAMLNAVGRAGPA